MASIELDVLSSEVLGGAGIMKGETHSIGILVATREMEGQR